MGRPRTQEIELTETERRELEELTRSRTAPHGLVRRARIVLASAARRANTEIARELGLSIPAVAHWRKRFLELGLVGLYGEHRPGRPRAHGDAEVAALLAKVLRERPAAGTHWTVRMAGTATGMPKSTVQRYLALFGVRPHRSKGFRLSPDPLFVDKVRDIGGLYLNPPDKAVVLCVDEKTQIQALERAQPAIPGGPGEPERVSHGYRRHGTTTLFAALDMANGEVLAECRARHRHQGFLGFLERLDAEVPAGLDVHLVIDNYCTHKHVKVRTWLAARPRFHAHFTPTYAS
jgi:putative transposase